ncbi:MAG: S1C family serine protease, partial [Planctomycetota bacterium]
MRPIVAFVIASLLLLPLGHPTLRPLRCCPDRAQSNCTGNPCRNDDTDHRDPVDVDDQALTRHLTRQGELLIEQGRMADVHDLIEQLSLDRCRLDLPQPRPIADGPVELYARAKDSVVVVGGLYKCKRCMEWHATTASGFVITSSGAVVTNYHVVNNPVKEALVVMTTDRRVFPVERVLAASRHSDLAILDVAAEGLTPLPIADTSAAAPIGSAVNVISHPAGRFYYYTSGIVSRYMKIRWAGRQIDALAITADYARGSSGAPVLNNQG